MVWWFPATGGVRRGAFPLEPMEYVFAEGTGVPFDVMYDTVHAVPATPVSAAQTQDVWATWHETQRKIVRTSDGTLYATYRKQLAGKYQIYVIKSEDDGATWTDDTRISTYALMQNYDQRSPSIAVDSADNLHVVWHGNASGYTTGYQIWYALYDGAWQTPIRISTAANMVVQHQAAASIAVDSEDNLHVVWYGPASDFAKHQIRYATAVSPYTATEWVTPIRISTAPNMGTDHQTFPCIAVDSGDNLHVIWGGQATGYTTNDQIWYAKGVPPYEAANWAAPIRISTALNMGINHQGHPCIAVDSGDNLHAVWFGVASDFANYQIRYATAVPPHGAGDWVTPIRISTAPNMGTNHQWYSSIAVDSQDYLHVLWNGKATGYLAQDVVWYAVYVASWATPVCLQPTGRNQYPVLRWSRWPR